MSISGNVDFSEFNPAITDAHKIKELHTGVPCRICFQVFARVRITWRYCAKCEEAFCEGEHGNWPNRNTAFCLRCNPKL
jgi:hypothetical protein